MRFKSILVVFFIFLGFQMTYAQNVGFECDETNVGEIQPLTEEECEAVGGVYGSGSMDPAPICTCPQLNFDKNMLVGVVISAIAFGFFVSKKRI